MPRDSTPPIVPNGLQQMPTTAISELHAVSALINRVKGELGRDIADEIVGEDLREARAALHLAAIAMAEAEARITRQHSPLALPFTRAVNTQWCGIRVRPVGPRRTAIKDKIG